MVKNCLLLNLSATTKFQWLFAEEILSPHDSLKSRTLFAIPHNFFLRNNAFIFFQKSDTITHLRFTCTIWKRKLLDDIFHIVIHVGTPVILFQTLRVVELKLILFKLIQILFIKLFSPIGITVGVLQQTTVIYKYIGIYIQLAQEYA